MPPTPTPSPTPPVPQSYVIQPGDTLTSIADKFNVSVQSLVDLNHIADPNYILAGTTIKIPPQ